MRYLKFSVLFITIFLTTAVSSAAENIIPSAPLFSDSNPPISPQIDIRVNNVEDMNPAVAFNNKQNEFMVVWEEQTGAAESSIYGQRVGAGGRKIGGAFMIMNNPHIEYVQPDLVYIPEHDKYWVVFVMKDFLGPNTIFLRAISWDGKRGDLTQLHSGIGNNEWYPKITYIVPNDEILVVYEDNSYKSIHSSRRRAKDGVKVENTMIAGAPDQTFSLPDVVHNQRQNNFLAAYTILPSPTSSSNIAGSIHYIDNPQEDRNIAITSPGYPPQTGVSLASSPDDFLAVWNEDHGTNYDCIWGRRILGNGSNGSYFKLAHEANKQRFEPAAAFGNGNRYLVVWRFVKVVDTTPNWDIYGRYIKASSDILEGNEFGIEYEGGSILQSVPIQKTFSSKASETPIDNFKYHQKNPAVDCGNFTPCLVVYQDGYPGPDWEIRGRLVGNWYTHLPFIVNE